MQYPIVFLKQDKEKSVRQKHPWIFTGAVSRVEEAETGQIVQVCTFSGEPLALGFFDSESQIMVKIFEFELPDQTLKPTYWHEKIGNAFERRQAMFGRFGTDCFRLINAEGDELPGLIVDVYKETAAVIYTHVGTRKLADLIESQLLELGMVNLYRMDQSHKQTISQWSVREFKGDLIVKENNLKFKIDPELGQKTGFFLDQRENRQLLRTLSKDKRILNAFGYTGGFSVYALAGEAREVHTVDISAEAIRMAEINVELNFGRNAPHKAIKADCFDFLREIDQPYDLIVLDPPAFAKHKATVDKAARGYKEINMQAAKSISPGGQLITFTCSQHISADLFQKIVFSALLDSGRSASIIHQLHQPADHPVSIFHPEGNYLKGLVLQFL